jgi:hypothetical protein
MASDLAIVDELHRPSWISAEEWMDLLELAEMERVLARDLALAEQPQDGGPVA